MVFVCEGKKMISKEAIKSVIEKKKEEKRDLVNVHKLARPNDREAFINITREINILELLLEVDKEDIALHGGVGRCL